MSSVDLVLDGKRALIIGGGGGGIGRQITRAFAAAGASVAVADLDADRAAVASDEIAATGATSCALSGDVRSGDDVRGFITDTVDRLGGLDILVTVVGGQVAYVPAVRLHEMGDDDWDLAHDVNVRYVALAAAAAIGVFLEQGTGGTIVSVGSVVGFMAAPLQAGYGAAKAGLVSLARTIGAEYAADGIRMNVVACGAILTAVTNADPSPDEVPEVPMGRYGNVGEIAEAAVYLASSSSSYMTGQSIVLDGGVSVRGPFED